MPNHLIICIQPLDWRNINLRNFAFFLSRNEHTFANNPSATNAFAKQELLHSTERGFVQTTTETVKKSLYTISPSTNIKNVNVGNVYRQRLKRSALKSKLYPTRTPQKNWQNKTFIHNNQYNRHIVKEFDPRELISQREHSRYKNKNNEDQIRGIKGNKGLEIQKWA